MSEVLLILSDAPRYDAANANMGFLSHPAETRPARVYKIMGELPGMSCPIYETADTGASSSEQGIGANPFLRRPRMPIPQSMKMNPLNHS